MSKLVRCRAASQVVGLLACLFVAGAAADDPNALVLPVENADAKTPAEMKPYAERVEHVEQKIELVPIPGGVFEMGSPDDEPGRNADEGPRHSVKVDPFWMGKYEITWDVYEVWMFDTDIALRKSLGKEPNVRDKAADVHQISQPTKPYTDMTFGMGKKGFPAISMTQEAARTFCDWLSAKTGRYYRLPTEAEWEYACRAGTKTAYSFGDDPGKLGEYAWYYDNSDEKYAKIGKKKPNPWGLYDMHGNVSEWVLDQYTTDFYGRSAGQVADNPLAIPRTEYFRVVRGGSWQDDPKACRSAARAKSIEEWKEQDPQVPQSIWYLTDAKHVGFRIVRPFRVPTAKERAEKWDLQEPKVDRRAKKTE